MTQEKDQQDRSEALENTLANGQEKKGFFARIKSPGDPLAQKVGAFSPAVFCYLLLAVHLFPFTGDDRPSLDVMALATWIPFCFFLMGAALLGGLKEQHDRFKKLETALAELKENPAE